MRKFHSRFCAEGADCINMRNSELAKEDRGAIGASRRASIVAIGQKSWFNHIDLIGPQCGLSNVPNRRIVFVAQVYHVEEFAHDD